MIRWRCTTCGKLTRGRLPPGGDGSLHYPARHRGADGQVCSGSFDEAQCVQTQDVEK